MHVVACRYPVDHATQVGSFVAIRVTNDDDSNQLEPNSRKSIQFGSGPGDVSVADDSPH